MGISAPDTLHRFVELDGVRVFYRETVPVAADENTPTVLLLHGFPSASHQYRRLMDALGTRYRLVAPDYPGFGHSDAPESDRAGGCFTYSFDRLADVMEQFVLHLGIEKFVMYLFDFGAPIGFRLATRHPDWVQALIIQNGNAYEDGLSEAAKSFIALGPQDEDAEERISDLLAVEATRGQYEEGVSERALIAPDGWTLDQHFLDLPGRKQPQIDLAFDYKNNVERYEAWQTWLRQASLPMLIVWGRYDPFFPEPGARAYLRDCPQAELHLFDTGHFALEECLPEIAPLIDSFLDRLRIG